VLSVDDPDGSCEQFGMLSIRDRDSCRIAFRALGLGTTAAGHSDSTLHAGVPEANADEYSGCLVYHHASWDLYRYIFNDIGPDKNSTKFISWPESFTPVCLSSPPRESCDVPKGCAKDKDEKENDDKKTKAVVLRPQTGKKKEEKEDQRPKPDSCLDGWVRVPCASTALQHFCPRSAQLK
ncbi:ANK1, partial [Symbiodinium microadriaticum]